MSFTSTWSFTDFNLTNSALTPIQDITDPRALSPKIRLWRLEKNSNFKQKIIFSYKVHFLMNGYITKHNCSIWHNTNPHEVYQIEMDPENVTVWRGFWIGSVIGTHFLVNEIGDVFSSIGSAGERYWKNSFGPCWNNLELDICGSNRMALSATQRTPHWKSFFGWFATEVM